MKQTLNQRLALARNLLITDQTAAYRRQGYTVGITRIKHKFRWHLARVGRRFVELFGRAV